MKKLFTVFLVLITFLTAGGIVLASDISGATYYGTIRATNSDSAAQAVSANATISTPDWIETGFINATADNSTVKFQGDDTAFMPGYNTNPWIVFFGSIPENSSVDATIYTNASDGEIRYFPDTGGMTTSDSATLELGNDFEIEQKVWLDTSSGSSKNLVYKEDAFRIYISGASEITAIIYSSVGWRSPTGFVDGTGAWVNETNAYDEDTGTETTDAGVGSGTWSEFLELTIASIECETVRFYANFQGGNQGIRYIDLDFYYDSSWHDVYQGEFDDETWVSKSNSAGIKDVTSARVRFYNDHPSVPVDAELFEFDFYEDEHRSVTATGIPSGEHTIKSFTAAGNFKIYIDGEYGDHIALDGASVPDNSNDWVFFQNDVAPYVEYHKITISSTLQQHIVWEYGATFDDLSAGNHDATPTFRTTTSDADVSASLIEFTPLQFAQSTTDPSGEWPSIMENPDMPETAYTEESRPGIFFEPLVYAIWTPTGLPTSLFWYNFAFFVIIMAGMIVYYFFAQKNIQALLIKIIVMGAIMGFFALPGPNIYGLYVVLYFAFFAFGVLIIARDYGW